MFATAFVALLSGLLLVLGWSAYRDMRPVLWWAAASFVQSIGLTLLTLSDTPTLDGMRVGGLVCVATSGALLWHAARLIEGRRPSHAFAIAGPMLVLVTALIRLPDPMISSQVCLLTIAAYLLHAAWIVGQSQQRLGSRWPLTTILGMHGLCLAITAMALGGISDEAVEEFGGGQSYLLLETLFFLIGSTIFVVAGLRERSEIGHRREGMLDSLTGLCNRGTFFALADARAIECRRDGRPLSVAVLDLDHFKRINDDFGHAMGDHVLTVFAASAPPTLGADAVLGRIGGEEFALLLPGLDREASLSLVETIRRRFMSDGALVGGQMVGATLSAGVASSAGEIEVAELMRQADGALYEAKAAGRNRVAAAGDSPPLKQAAVVRVA